MGGRSSGEQPSLPDELPVDPMPLQTSAGFSTWPIQCYAVWDGSVDGTTPGEWDPVTSFQIIPSDSWSSHPDVQFFRFLSSFGGSHGTITFGSDEISATPTHRIL